MIKTKCFSKTVLVLFIIAHLLCMVAMNEIGNVDGVSEALFFVVEILLMFLMMLFGNPFVLVGIIFSIINIRAYRKWRSVICLISGVLMIIPVFIYNAIASIEGVGMFAEDNIAWVFYVPYGILVIFCALNVIHYKKNYYVTNAVCIHNGGKFSTYEYEVIENGVKTLRVSEGPSFGQFRKNVTCKIFVHKTKINDVAGYGEYKLHLVLMIIIAVATVIPFIFDKIL